MTKETEGLNNLEQLAAFRFAKVAKNAFESGNLKGAQAALGLLARDMNKAQKMGPYAGWVEAITNVREPSPESIESVANEYTKQYGAAKEGISVAEAVNSYYTDIFKFFGENDMKMTKTVLSQFGEEKIGGIAKKLKWAKHIKSGEESGVKYSENMKKKAEAIEMTYEPIMNALNDLEEMKMGHIATELQGPAYKAKGADIAKKLEPYLPQAA